MGSLLASVTRRGPLGQPGSVRGGPEPEPRPEWAAAARQSFGGLPEPDLNHRLLKVAEDALLREALAHCGGNRTAAAKLLGLDLATLRTRLRILGLDD